MGFFKVGDLVKYKGNYFSKIKEKIGMVSKIFKDGMIIVLYKEGKYGIMSKNLIKLGE